MTDQKSDSNKGASNQNKGSGSDTASAAKISAGTSVGNVGEVPMPHAQAGGAQAGGAQAGTSAGHSAQGGTTTSHTSKPLGGNAGPTGAGRDQGSHTGSAGMSGQGASGHSASGQSSSGQSSSGQSSLGQGSSGQSSSGQSSFGQGSSGQSSSGQSSFGQGSQGGMSGEGGIGETARQASGQAQQRANEAYEQASEWAQETIDRASSWASETFGGNTDRYRGGARSGRAGGGIQRYAAENPMMVGIVGLAAGLLLGALLPRSRREDEVFGEWADEVRDQGLRYAQEAAQRGREFVEDALGGDDPRFARHESEFRSENSSSANRH